MLKRLQRTVKSRLSSRCSRLIPSKGALDGFRPRSWSGAAGVAFGSASGGDMGKKEEKTSTWAYRAQDIHIWPIGTHFSS
jgi:hypothetical protein